MTRAKVSHRIMKIKKQSVSLSFFDTKNVFKIYFSVSEDFDKRTKG